MRVENGPTANTPHDATPACRCGKRGRMKVIKCIHTDVLVPLATYTIGRSVQLWTNNWGWGC